MIQLKSRGLKKKENHRGSLKSKNFYLKQDFLLNRIHLLSLQLEQKVIASEIFKGKKDNYPQSVPRLFINTRLGE